MIVLRKKQENMTETNNNPFKMPADYNFSTRGTVFIHALCSPFKK